MKTVILLAILAALAQPVLAHQGPHHCHDRPIACQPS